MTDRSGSKLRTRQVDPLRHWLYTIKAVETARRSGRTLCLPAGEGLSLCDVIKASDLEDKVRLMAQANTWIAMAQADPD
jgi:hypothetical protein